MNNDFLKQFYWGKVIPWELRQNSSELTELNSKIDADITALKHSQSAFTA